MSRPPIAANESILVSDDDGVRTITINRPSVRNAMNQVSSLLLASALDALDDTPQLRVGVITGAAGVFCAGMDLKALQASGERPISEARGAFGIVEKPPTKPLIAAVEGYALGGGLEIALACDLIIASDDATLGLPEVRRGLVAAAGGAFRLPRRLPYHVALELLLTGDPVSARRAYDLGLVSRLTRPGEALVTAQSAARRIAENAPLAVAASKRIAARSLALREDEAFRYQEPILDAVRRSDDAKEGARAFAEKRVPQWRGR